MKSTVLCYNLKDTKKGRKIGMIFALLGYKVRHVEPSEYQISLGDLVEGDYVTPSAGERESEETSVACEGKGAQEELPVICEETGFQEEMLVIHADNRQMFDRALAMMRKEKAVVTLKAVLTETNRTWDSIRLHDEILQEHQYMTAKRAERT